VSLSAGVCVVVNLGQRLRQVGHGRVYAPLAYARSCLMHPLRMPPSAPALLPRCPPRSKIEAQTRQVLSGKDINDLYDGEAAAVRGGAAAAPPGCHAQRRRGMGAVQGQDCGHGGSAPRAGMTKRWQSVGTCVPPLHALMASAPPGVPPPPPAGGGVVC
jgi:hypothetical protein